MTKDQLLHAADVILREGRPYKDVALRDSRESGPYTLTSFGFRWGQLKVELAQNGSVWLFRKERNAWCIYMNNIASAYFEDGTYAHRRRIKHQLEDLRSRGVPDREGKCARCSYSNLGFGCTWWPDRCYELAAILHERG